MMSPLNRKVTCLACIVAVGLILSTMRSATVASAGAEAADAKDDSLSAPQRQLRAALKKLPYKIVFETRHGDDWELYAMNADGAGKVNLTNNPEADELYPHVSPDGTKICFVADEGTGGSKVRSVYAMNADGTDRKKVATNARQPSWSPDGKQIVYVRGEYKRFTYSSYGTKGLFFYDTVSRKHRRHGDQSILHICYMCWAPGGEWILATINGGMGYAHTNLAIKARGRTVRPVWRLEGCRPDVSADGKKILWNMDDQTIVTADIDQSTTPPTIGKPRVVLSCDWSEKVYHGDWSPCGKYIAFSRGPYDGSQHVGEPAPGWDICVADAEQVNVWVPLATDGACSKEPDWMVVNDKEVK